MPRESAQQIDVAAAAWAARVDRGLTSEEEASLDVWLGADPRRTGAYAKALAVAIHTEHARALGLHYDPDKFEAAPQPNSVSRRAAMLGSVSLAVGLAAAVVARITLSSGRYATERGEVRIVPLEDGSVVTLNTASKMAVVYIKDRREIRLIEGEALFDVAKDPQRPFIVHAGDALVTAVGTSFAVSRLARAPVQVFVREGVVEVQQLSTAQPVRLVANTKAIAPITNGAVQTSVLHPEEIRKALAWRTGQIAFEGEALAQAAAEFGRYRDIRVIIDDPTLRQEGITGLFQANDPVGFAQAVAVALNVHVEVGADEVRLSR